MARSRSTCSPSSFAFSSEIKPLLSPARCYSNSDRRPHPSEMSPARIFVLCEVHPLCCTYFALHPFNCLSLSTFSSWSLIRLNCGRSKGGNSSACHIAIATFPCGIYFCHISAAQRNHFVCLSSEHFAYPSNKVLF